MTRPQPQTAPVPKTVLAGVFLVSLSVLTLEIVLTRILSVVLSYHYVFLVVSMAMLGLGLGGVLAFLRRRETEKADRARLVRWAGLFAATAGASVLAVVRVPYMGSVLLYGLMVLAPFLFAGAAISTAFQVFGTRAGRLYGADLTGAASGALLAVPLLNVMDAVSAGLLAAVVAGAGALTLTQGAAGKPWHPAAAATALAVVLLVTSSLVPSLRHIAIGQNVDKEISTLLSTEAAGRIVDTRWSSFGRTDLVELRDNPDMMALFIDGTAGTPMYRYTGNVDRPGPAAEGLKSGFPGYFPFRFLRPEEMDNALVIGPGGGRDILLALMGGVQRITAVDVNPDLIEMVRQYSSYNGGIYTSLPNVEVIVSEGRSFLRRDRATYDIIMLSLPVTKTSRSPEGFALTENFLFTKESMAEYLDHLTPEGRLIVLTHGSFEVLKLVSLAAQVLTARGIPDQEVMDYVYTVGSHNYSLFVLTKSRLTPEQSLVKHQAVHSSSLDPAHSYFPYVRPSANTDHLRQDRFDECQMLNATLMALGYGLLDFSKLTTRAAQDGLDITVATDDRPFFYQFDQGLPGSVILAFLLALVFLLVSILVPHAAARKRGETVYAPGQRPEYQIPLSPVWLFAMLGMGFMMAEISLIQRFILFLGEPVLSLTVLLFAILVGAGLGGLASSQISLRAGAVTVGLACLGVALLIAGYAVLAPAVLDSALQLSLPVRSLVAAAMLAPLGFSLGFPFPLGIRLMSESKLDKYVPWMWGVNGAASVLGSVGAIIIGMKLGFTQALMAGGAAYLVATLQLLAARALRKS